MDKEEKRPIRVNVDFTNAPELFVALDEMVAEDLTDRSKLIKKLIRDERKRRAAQAGAVRQHSRKVAA